MEVIWLSKHLPIVPTPHTAKLCCLDKCYARTFRAEEYYSVHTATAAAAAAAVRKPTTSKASHSMFISYPERMQWYENTSFIRISSAPTWSLSFASPHRFVDDKPTLTTMIGFSRCSMSNEDVHCGDVFVETLSIMDKTITTNSLPSLWSVLLSTTFLRRNKISQIVQSTINIILIASSLIIFHRTPSTCKYWVKDHIYQRSFAIILFSYLDHRGNCTRLTVTLEPMKQVGWLSTHPSATKTWPYFISFLLFLMNPIHQQQKSRTRRIIISGC